MSAIEAYFAKYDRVYDPVANAKAEAEKAERAARRNAEKARSGTAKKDR